MIRPRHNIFTGLYRTAAVCAVLILVTGCGFHLRGAVDLPPSLQRTYVDADGVDRKVVRELSQALRSSGVEVVRERSAAGAVLTMSQQYDRRALSVDDNSDVREYELVYELRFDIRSVNGETVLSNQRVELYRDYTHDKDNILGKREEEDSIRESMMRDAVQQVMRRLQATLGKAA